MSYSVNSACWNCKNQDKCTDHVKIGAAVQDIHKDCLSTESGHMGSGSIIIQCCRLDAKDK